MLHIASGAVIEDRPEPPTPAQEFARSGGLKGGDARAKALSPKQRREIAQKATAKRWGKKEQGHQTTSSGLASQGPVL
jgi:hypothetical protein